jgi:hypothetical protein
MKFFSFWAALLISFASGALAQQAPHAIVTAEARDGAAPVELNRDQISATVDGKPARIREWAHLAGANAALQLYILIDDGTRTDVANQYNDLRSFIQAQPASTEIGLAYLQNGIARIAAPLSADHAAVGKALRVSMGQAGIAASPYMGLSDLFKKWPAAEARREVLLISSGADPYYRSFDLQDPYLMKAMDDATRGAIVVNSIYYAAAGHYGHSFFNVNMGQNYLSELAEGTGGEFYWQGLRSPISFSPFLQDLARHLNNQYLLTLDAAGLKTGFHPIRLSTAAQVSLLAPTRIYVSK